MAHDYFTKEHFELLDKWKGQKRDKSNPEQDRAYQELADAYIVTEEWANGIRQELFPSGSVKIRKCPINQANNFFQYQWARIYPKANSPKELAYIVSIDLTGFAVRIDTVGVSEKKPIRQEYLKLSGLYDPQSPFIAILSVDEGLQKSLAELVEWSVNAIQNFEMDYDAVVEKLGLNDELDDQSILGHFDGKQIFKQSRSSWPPETVTLFCHLARTVHSAGLDWYHGRSTQYGQLRFGRKEQGKSIGKPWAYMNYPRTEKTPLQIYLFDPIGDIEKGRYTLSDVMPQLEDSLITLTQENPPTREGWWPDELLDDDEASEFSSEDDVAILASNTALNRIFYGPPGTGKTYTTIEAALQIVDPEFFVDNPEPSREAQKNRFDELSEAGQIRFVTFHQSFSYEDFVEGLRASSENGSILYSVEPGIFKALCCDAGENITASENPFSKALSLLQEKCENSPEQRLVATTKSGKKFEFEYDGGLTFKVFPSSSKSENPRYFANIEHVRRLYSTGEGSNIYNKAYVEGLLAFLKADCGLPDQPIGQDQKDKLKNYVLIIDEINRGNISKIFGELITLIEASKRIGQPEELRIQLPYSKESFGVPSNVYLIGTMNTADRSLAGLDKALRRRFTFTEMYPNPKLLDDINVPDVIEANTVNIEQMLRKMNERIEVLLDREHCLGHAYFMPLKNNNSFEKLKCIFRHEIPPLLEEYFFEDWERIHWVLNDHNKSPAHQFIQKASATPESVFGSKFEGNVQDRRWHINEDAFKKFESYRGILGMSE
jgi:5-methylcytosine-specific restriction protein B